MAALCDTLLVSRAGFYAWRRETECVRARRDRELMPLVRDIFWHHKRRYGARRIAVELHSRGQSCGVDRVAKLLKMQGLRAIQPKSFVPKTTDSRHQLGYSPNLLATASSPERVNQIWVADITYIPLRTGAFAYLALLMDLFSRRIIGWELDRTLEDDLALAALRMALRSRTPAPGLVHHSDRGIQYASKDYTDLLKHNGVNISMSRKKNPWDNAQAESFMKTLKYEEVYRTEYRSLEDARASIGEFLDKIYNRERLHSALGYRPPLEFEHQLRCAQAVGRRQA